jgi:glycerol-3-phosphate dehydrogenase
MIPWHDHVVVGTTDTPIEHISEEPQPFQHELDFLLKTISDHVDEAPSLSDCLSVFTGIRPLVRASATKHTKKLSRDHTIDVAPSGLVTITGGKWTTYRKMAEDCVDHVAKLADLPVAKCITHDLKLQKTLEDEAELKRSPDGLASFDAQLHSQLRITRADLVRGVRYEFARTVEDLLARRTRALFLNAQAAIDMAPEAAMILATELGRDMTWRNDQVRTFVELAKTYIPTKR